MTLETEVKFYVPDLDQMQQRLIEAGAVLHKARVFEENIRYDNALGTLTSSGIVLRLRQDDRVRITYKAGARQRSAGSATRYELETEVSDFAVMDEILRRLGFVTSMIYEKYRTTFHLGEAEVVLDEMPFGNFIEIEGTTDQIEGAIQRLKMADQKRILGSYVYLFDQVKLTLDLDFRDLSFENFRGLHVPGEIFER